MIALAGGLLTRTASAAPGDVLFSDGFERAALAPWTTTNTTRSGIATGAQVSNGGTRGAFTRFNTVSVVSPTFNASVPAAEVAIWVRRGSDAFSEYPDGGEDLLLEYRRIDGSFGILKSYPGGGPEGEIFNDSLFLPPDALHGSAALRLRQTRGSNSNFDYYHFDDVRVTERAPAGELAVGSCDDFSAGLATNWSVDSGGGSAGTNSATFQSPTLAMFTNGAAVTVTSNGIDTTSPAFDVLSMWIRRGADAFSENPDGNENFVVEYLNDIGGWELLESFAGSGTPGQIFSREYAIPANGRHAGFRVRFRQLSGSGPNFDFWHVDDVCLDTRNLPALSISKVVSTISDPLNGTTNPLAIPGAFVQYQLSVENNGTGNVDSDSLVITDALDSDIALLVDDGGSPAFVFVDGPVPSGLSFDPFTGVTYSNQPGGGPPYGYTPTPDGSGVDPTVTGIRLLLSGEMNPNTVAGVPSFQIRFNAQVQ
ncbi:MAG: hypothetical protein AB8F65_10405 [Woeseiaceae bacterium]